MKVLFASVSVLLLMAGAAAFVLLNETENARGYVADAFPDSLEEQVRDSVRGVGNAVRNLTEPSDATTDEAADAAVDDNDTPGTPEPAWEIGGTEGAGVAFRSECREHSRVEGAFEEGEPVSVIARGVGDCSGWTLVASEQTHKTSWVADGYLVVRASEPPPSGTPTLVAAPASPSATVEPTRPPTTATPTQTATAAPSATATASPTPTATATATPTSTSIAGAPAVWFGQLDGSAGDIVSAWIDGVECEATTAYANDGAALYYLPVSASAPCDPSPGAEVEFRVNGVTLAATGTWQPGSSTELALQ